MCVYICIISIISLYVYTQTQSDAQSICSPPTNPPTNAQPVSKQQTFPQPTPFSFIGILVVFVCLFLFFSLHMMSYSMEYPFHQFSPAVLVLSPPNNLCPLAPLLAGQYQKLRRLEHPWLRTALLTNTLFTTGNQRVIKICFSLKAKGQTHTRHYEGKQLCPS